MYSVVLVTMVGFGTTAADCCWNRTGNYGYRGYPAYTNWSAAPAMPIGCGCSPCPSCAIQQCPSCGGMPMASPPMMGGIGFPANPPTMGGAGIPQLPAGGTILPPAGLGESTAPAPPPLNENRSSPTQAMFVVRLPRDARLLADGTEIPGSGEVRIFMSPPLEPGKQYYYEVTIEVDRGGKILRDPQRVEFSAGKTANVTFTEPRADTPAPPLAAPLPPTSTRIRVRVPEGAALYVEGRPWGSQIVQTPPLDPSRTHYYRLTVESIQNGRRSFVSREVAFRAGQDLTVDFTTPGPISGNVAKNSR